MKVKIKDLMDEKVIAAVEALYKTNITGAGTRFKVAKFVKKFQSQLSDAVEQRNASIKAYGEPIPDKAGMFSFTPENQALFSKDVADLGEIDIVMPELDLSTVVVPGLSAEHLVNLMDIVNVIGPDSD